MLLYRGGHVVCIRARASENVLETSYALEGNFAANLFISYLRTKSDPDTCFIRMISNSITIWIVRLVILLNHPEILQCIYINKHRHK
jgi:hypothetical protein